MVDSSAIWPEAVRARPYLARGACAELLDCDDPEVIICGPAETGKTMAALSRLNRLAWQWPGMQGAIIRRTHRSMAGTVLQTFKDKVLAKGSPVRVLGGTNPDRYIYPNGSQLWVGGMDQPEKVLSAERDVIYVNQAEELPLDHWEFLSTRVTGRAGNVPNPQLIGDCNPAAPTHWIRQRSLAGNMRMIESTHKDNPTLYDARGKLTEQGKRTLARLDRLTGTRKMRFRYGIWAQPEGAIYEAFDEVRHKVPSKPIPALWPRVVGIDPFGARIGAVFLAFDPGQGILNVYDEYLEPFGITTPGHVAGLLKQARGQTIFAWVGGGPSERQARVDWAGAGIPLLEVPISDVWAGIDRVNQLLADFRLVVHDNCTHLLAEIGSYQRKLKDGVPTEAIQDKENFHLLDSLRYIVAWLTEPGERSEVVYRPVRIGPDY
jgi:phage terminase large subunit